jgi:hypothetical protein
MTTLRFTLPLWALLFLIPAMGFMCIGIAHATTLFVRWKLDREEEKERLRLLRKYERPEAKILERTNVWRGGRK